MVSGDAAFFNAPFTPLDNNTLVEAVNGQVAQFIGAAVLYHDAGSL